MTDKLRPYQEATQRWAKGLPEEQQLPRLHRLHRDTGKTAHAWSALAMDYAEAERRIMARLGLPVGAAEVHVRNLVKDLEADD